MIRKLQLLTAALFALYCSSALSVSMGDLELQSALNQRFEAEIELKNVGRLGVEEILPNLASLDDFNRAGVERSYQLTDLRFKVNIREDGTFVILVTSTKPIIEPFLNFIVEVIWPTGRILREYTVLLDPPVFGTEGIEKIELSQTDAEPSANAGRSRPSQPARESVRTAPVANPGRTEGVMTADDEYGVTGPGDTLWTIATKVRPNDSVSVQQTMLALQRANPDAFINNNINLLKAGFVLRVPDADEIGAGTTSEAIAEIRVQNEEFADYKAGEVTQLDARRTAQSDSTVADDDGEGELKLLAADLSGSRAGYGDDRNEELENELAVAREDLDRARRANTEINARLDDLGGQIETLNEIVKLKDDQLAALRAELQRSQSESSAQPATTQVATTPRQQSPSLLQNPIVLGGVGVLLIAIIVAAMILLRRRRQQSDDIGEEDFQPMLIEDNDTIAPGESVNVVDEASAADEEEEEVTQQTSDVIGEAEIYIAYGRFPQAISFLQNAIESEPARADIQLKLLEVYVQTEDATAFNLQFDQLKLLNDEAATAEALQLQSQIPGAAESSAAAMDATIVSSEPIAAIEEPTDDDDDDLSFDLDDLDAETEDDALDLSEELDDGGDELSLDEAMELGEADLDLDLDAALDEPAGQNDNGSVDDLDLDLDLDLDEELDLDLDADAGELDETLQLDTDAADELDLEADLDLEDELDLEADLDLEGDLDLEADLDLSDELDGEELDLASTPAADESDPSGEENLDATVSLAADEEGLDLGDDDLDLDLDDDDFDLGDDDLDLGDDDLDLGDDDLDLGDDDLDLSDELDLGDDDALDLNLDGDDDIELDLSDEGDELDLDVDDDLDLGELDDDLGELNLDEDAGSKLDLARAYIEMGDNDGAKSLLQEVISEGDEAQIGEANELLGKLD
ncbi:MAG: FimV/HubP family polar landmark protein [Pseudomonadales bacterium]